MATVKSPTILVRAATLADSGVMAQLSGQLGYPSTPAQTEKRLRHLLSDPRHAVIVAELKATTDSAAGEIIGWVHVQERPVVQADLRAEVTALVVGDSHRRLGAGRLLMERAEEWARERGCAAVMLRSNVKRTWAHAFYEAIGYSTLKVQKTFLKEFSHPQKHD